ncbi:unnamed protein product [Debaryomyces tyrocola]|nr:unnamed protein product [Debaryomyces tyrocola]
MIHNDHEELSDKEFDSLRESCLKGTFFFVIDELTRTRRHTNSGSPKLSILSIFEIQVRICVILIN